MPAACFKCLEDQDRVRDGEFAERRREARIKYLKSVSGLGAKWVDASFDSFKTDLDSLHKMRKVQYKPAYLPAMRNCKNAIMDWGSKFQDHRKTGRSLVVLGDVGTGKNHLTSALINYVIENFFTRCLFTSVTQIFLELKDSFSRSDVSEKSILDKFTSVGLLVVNEVGLNAGTDYEFEKINYILNERIDQRLPFVLVSNLSSEQLALAVGDRLADRIAEHPVLNFKWPSFRPDGSR
ncbi:hypothetical protein LCGC14_0430550 [marine sediment metagenome]|uniref:IstB-like ATP-binding domain-containing protein n=1 Tax=marine sediment metagenome TaxID=412755 RepID=A0A0F9T6D3_9ZZZZ